MPAAAVRWQLVCLVCSRLGEGRLCERCRAGMIPAPERLVGHATVVRPALLHSGPARTLVHLLKYRGVVAAGRVLAEHMAPLVSSGAVLVPVPRLRWRLLKYGVDPALELARAVSVLTGSPVVRVLSPPLVGRSRAGRVGGTTPRFGSRAIPAGRLVLVDDVITTGATIASALYALGRPAEAVTATGSAGSAARGSRAGQRDVTSLRDPK